MAEATRSPASAPEYAKHREGPITAVDTLPEANIAHGMNMRGFLRANIQVNPSGGANPSVSVLFWNQELGQFVQANPALTFAGVGADTPFEIGVDVNSRIIFVAVTTLAAGQVDSIFVAGSELDHLK